MLVTAGSALVPELAYPGAYIVCSNGTVQTDTKVEYPYSGKTVVSRNTICIKGNTSTSITLPAAIISFFLYATIFSLLFKFIPHRKE